MSKNKAVHWVATVLTIMHGIMQANSELTELFELEATEELLERFACALLQTYTCQHNDFTPEQQVVSISAVCLS